MPLATKLRLHKPHGTNKYCGPTAMSAITGFSTDECAAVARMVSGKPSIKGLSYGHLRDALDRMGVTLVPIATPERKARAAIDALPETVRQRVVIMCAGHHYQTFLRESMVCSLTGRELVHINSMPKPAAKLARLWLVEFRTAPALPKMAATKTRNAEKAKAAKKRRETRLRAARLGLSIEKYDDWLDVVTVNHALWREAMKLDPAMSDEDVREEFYNEVLCGHALAHDWDEAADIIDNVAKEMKRLTGIVVD